MASRHFFVVDSESDTSGLYLSCVSCGDDDPFAVDFGLEFDLTLVPEGTQLKLFSPTGIDDVDFPDAVVRMRKRKRLRSDSLSGEDQVYVNIARQSVTVGASAIVNSDLRNRFLSDGDITVPIQCKAMIEFRHSNFADIPRVREYKARMLDAVRRGLWSHENPAVSTTQLPADFCYPIVVVSGLRKSPGVMRLNRWINPSLAEVDLHVLDYSVGPLDDAELRWEGVLRNSERYSVTFGVVQQCTSEIRCHPP